MYYVSFDENNKINGFFNDQLNSVIPAAAISITDEKWQELSASPEKYILQNGEIVAVEVSQYPVIKVINWAGFNTAMMLSDSYAHIIKNTTNQEAKTRLEIAAVRLELKSTITEQDKQIFKLIWDSVIEAIPANILVAADLEQINQIASANNMPFNFDSEFKLHFSE